jgi:predicted DNA-binding transcriptional regulator YafY
MNIIQFSNRISKINYLIKHQITGNPSEFSKKLNLSERRLYELLEQLKLMDVPIKYSKNRMTYYYCNPYFNLSTHLITE